MTVLLEKHLTVLFLIACICIENAYPGKETRSEDTDFALLKNLDGGATDENVETDSSPEEHTVPKKEQCVAEIKNVYKDCTECQIENARLKYFIEYTFTSISLADIEKKEERFATEFINYLNLVIFPKLGVKAIVCVPYECIETLTPEQFCDEYKTDEKKKRCHSAMKNVGLIEDPDTITDDLPEFSAKALKLSAKEKANIQTMADLTNTINLIFTDFTVEKVKNDLPADESECVVNYIEHVKNHYDINDESLYYGHTLNKFCDDVELPGEGKNLESVEVDHESLAAVNLPEEREHTIREDPFKLQAQCLADILKFYDGCTACHSEDKEYRLTDFAEYTFTSILLADVEKEEGGGDEKDIIVNSGEPTDVNRDIATDSLTKANEKSIIVNSGEYLDVNQDIATDSPTTDNLPKKPVTTQTSKRFATKFINYISRAIDVNVDLRNFVCFLYECTTTLTPTKFCNQNKLEKKKKECIDAMTKAGWMEFGLIAILKFILTDITIEKAKKDFSETDSVYVVDYIIHVSKNHAFNRAYLHNGRTVISFCYYTAVDED